MTVRAPLWKHLRAALLLVSALLLATSPVAASVGWELVGPKPPGRAGHAMAYDSARERLVLFGGGNQDGYLADTWEWDGASWVNVTPAVSPPARSGHAMAYDSARGRVVLFGGRPPYGDYPADTWEWDGTTWVDVTPAVSPPGREAPAMAYDSARGRVVLFGGANRGYLDDTWEWDGTAWVNVTPAVNPLARYFHALVYDSARGRVVLFGGRGPYIGDLADTWEWDGTAWVNVTPASSPPSRSRHGLAYDSARGRVVMFGGESEPPSATPVLYTDTWEWDGTAWVKVTPAVSPLGRGSPAMAYDTSRGRVVLFGGYTLSLLTDTWEWNGASWVDVTPALIPPVRWSHALAYDSARGRVVLFGGSSEASSSGKRLDDTWEWDGAAWSNVTPAVSPPARYSHALAYDSARGRVVLFGGYGSGGALADTWEWDGAVWVNVTPPVSPPARIVHSLTYDSARGRVVLFGGYGIGGAPADTWEWDGAAWMNVTPGVSPSARSYHALAYDSARERVVLFGGFAGATYVADTWEWDGSVWMNVTPVVSPSARIYHALAYDSARERVVLFGGFAGGTYFADTWEWDGTAWVDVTAAVSPSIRVGHALAYDSARSQVVLFGGVSSISSLLADTWEYGPPLERTCDGQDDNANGLIDEGCDGDGDGYCAAGMPVVGLPPVCPLGGGDCEDADGAMHPGAAEICDGLDDDCDGARDEDFDDEDSDGFGDTCDNCPLAYNPSQANSDGNADGGDACDMTITAPLDGTGLCGGLPPTITWSTQNYDRWRVLISWDPSFDKKQLYTSGDKLLKSPSWTPKAKKWSRVCANANPNLYIKVYGKSAGAKSGQLSDAVVLEVK